MAFHSERVLLTGIGGFTGPHLAAKLRQDGHEVIGIGRHPGEGTFLDLCDGEATNQMIARVRPSAVVHLAGISEPTYGNTGEIYASNVVATANLFAALSASKIEPSVVIVASSATVYATGQTDLPIKEDFPLAPKSHYAISKRTVEDIVNLYAARFPVITTRPFNYTGPGQSTNFLVAKIVQHFVEKRREIRLGNLGLYRDISDITRVVEAYAKLLNRPDAPVTVNICSGRVVHLADILAIMQSLSGREMDVITDQALIRTNEARVIRGSPARLESLVGPLPNPDFRETLARMYNQAITS